MEDNELSSESPTLDPNPSSTAEPTVAEAVPVAPKKDRRLLVLLLLLALIVAGVVFAILTAGDRDREWDEAHREQNTIHLTFDDSVKDVTDAQALNDEVWPDDEMGFWHAHLSDEEQAMYDELYPHLVAHEESFHLSGECVRQDVESEWAAVVRVIDAIIDDHPELFWVNQFQLGPDGGYWLSYSYNTDNLDLGSDCTATYAYTAEESEQIGAKIDAAIDTCLQQVDKDAPDYLKALQVMLWLADTVSYDTEAIEAAHVDEAGGNSDQKLLNRAHYDQYAPSALIDNLSVCSGYARAYQLILTRLGIPCTIVSGTVGNHEQLHAWNLFCLSGKIGYCDPTFADGDYSDWVYMDEMTSDEEDLEALNENSIPDGLTVAYDNFSTPYRGQYLEYFFMDDTVLDFYNHTLDEFPKSVVPKCDEPLLVGINGYWYTDWKLVDGVWEGQYW